MGLLKQPPRNNEAQAREGIDTDQSDITWIVVSQSNNEAQAREGIDTMIEKISILMILPRNNEAQAREGIDTKVAYSFLTEESLVTMRHKPERALTHQNVEVT